MKTWARWFDVEVSRQIARLPRSWYGALAWLSLVVRPWTWMAVVAAGLGLAVLAADYQMSWLSAGVLLLLPLSEIIKMVFKRQRPESIYVEHTRIRSYSFPSGHAYSAALGSGYLIVWLTQLLSGGWLVVAGVGLVVFGLTVAGSRIYLGAHFPTDVIAGLLLGVTVLVGLVATVGVTIGGLA